MLRKAKELDLEIGLTMLIRDIAAYDPETGAYLRVSRGRSHYAPKWFLFFGDPERDGEYRPYREWRTIFRAWDTEEALAIANEKLTKLKEKGRVHISAPMFA